MDLKPQTDLRELGAALGGHDRISEDWQPAPMSRTKEGPNAGTAWSPGFRWLGAAESHHLAADGIECAARQSYAPAA